MNIIKDKTNINECVEIRVSRKPGNVYDIYLHNEIMEPHYYVDLLSTLRNCSEEDEIHLYINSWGGHLSTAIQIINAIQQCKSVVTTIVECEAHSAASLIFLAGKNFVVQPGAAMLCHFYSSGEIGKGNEIKSAIEFKDKHFKQQFSTLYEGFLTASELQKLFSGTDLWLNAKDIHKRLQNKVKLLNKAAKKNKSNKNNKGSDTTEGDA